jgi:hypothetical protein
MGLAREIHRGFCWGNLKERGIDRRKIMKWFLKKWDERV